ncbi:hypothetical protein DBR06_SOUSAS3110014, partial [Sousa chinensis]
GTDWCISPATSGTEKRGPATSGQNRAGSGMGHDPGSVRGGAVPAEWRTRVGRDAAPRDFQVVVRTLRAKEGGQEGAQPIVKEYWDVQPVGEGEEAEEEEE